MDRKFVNFRSLSALLDVRLHELLGVALEHLVDFVQQIVELGLDLLAALRCCRRLFDNLVVLLRCRLLLLLSLCHRVSSHSTSHEPSRSRSSAADEHSSINLPTCASVPRIGSIIGTRRSGSPPMSKTSESQFAATIESPQRCRHLPRKYALVSGGGSDMARSTSSSVHICSSPTRPDRPFSARRSWYWMSIAVSRASSQPSP